MRVVGGRDGEEEVEVVVEETGRMRGEERRASWRVMKRDLDDVRL